MAKVKTGRGMCPKHDRWEGTTLKGGKMEYDCGLTINVGPMKLVTAHQPQKTAPTCFDCAVEMKREGRTKYFVCPSCGGRLKG